MVLHFWPAIYIPCLGEIKDYQTWDYPYLEITRLMTETRWDRIWFIYPVIWNQTLRVEFVWYENGFVYLSDIILLWMDLKNQHSYLRRSLQTRPGWLIIRFIPSLNISILPNATYIQEATSLHLFFIVKCILIKVLYSFKGRFLLIFWTIYDSF